MVSSSLLLLATLFAFQQYGQAPVLSVDDEGDKEVLEKILIENILPFWYPSTLDQELGGYRLNHDMKGNWRGPAPKALVTQARTVWFFSRLVRSGHGSGEHLKAARHGYQFLKEKLWDSEHGGFFWEVDASGAHATKPDKHLYGQSFGLYALSEYGMAAGDREALELAKELFRVLEYRAHDPSFGGYREFFLRDWSTPPQHAQGYMKVDPSVKLMNTHLHLMEAFTTYYQATRDGVARERLIELIQIQGNAVVRKQTGACTDKYYRNWTPMTGDRFERVSYGHDIENVWLLVDACTAAGISNGPLLDLYMTLADYSLTYGFDWNRGGFYDWGRFSQEAEGRDKVWWVQAEGLVGTLRMYQLTRDLRYREAFSKTLSFIVEEMVDWDGGEWYATVPEEGAPSGDKAGPWKSPYHNGRAMIECLEILNDISDKTAGPTDPHRAAAEDSDHSTEVKP
jgi:mannobiose 2-epimerase